MLYPAQAVLCALRKERPALVETSALEVVSILPEEIAQLRGAAGQNAPLVRLLLQLESATVHLRQMVQELNDDSWQSLEEVLFSFRRDAIPLVDVLINLLAEDDQIRQKAEELVAVAMSSLPTNLRLEAADVWMQIPR